MIAATSIAELRTLAGRELGASDWLEVTHRARAGSTGGASLALVLTFEPADDESRSAWPSS